MLKSVKRLKKRHRKYLWVDREGTLWVYVRSEKDWCTFTWADGFPELLTTQASDGWPDGPFYPVPVFDA
ncbi:MULTISPECIES: hypothetical protein [Mycobacteroides]|uniref:hypothetical protein n=1 Tax=Mycobacteroides TaxID=670516 RepID=UPI0008A90D39|nr:MULTISPECIES: hypothetical protein [Mycobacteroides]OHU64042.1 hypothetical protein BKG85_11475 [Mycobacteroides chelonae]SIL61490.1 Uncharacterised protein [Mycobacteroides abscessus subsp. abscessus]